MKQVGHSKRPRGRSTDRQRSSQRHSSSNSADTKGKGNPQQVVEKYLTLARDAASSGDPISAENYFQYADHYYRLASAYRASRSSEKKESQRKNAQNSKEPPSDQSKTND